MRKRFATVAQFSVLGDTSSASGFSVSVDSTTLFTPGDPETAIIYAYSLATQQLVGWVPNLFMEPISGGGASGPIDSPYLLANDGTGLFAGPMEEGIGFVDVSASAPRAKTQQRNPAIEFQPAAILTCCSLRVRLCHILANLRGSRLLLETIQMGQ